MKREYISLCILLMMCLLILSGCRRMNYEKDWNRYDAMTKDLLPALISSDSEMVFSLVSPSLLSTDSKHSIADMVEGVEGELVEWEYRPSSCHVSSSKHGMHMRTRLSNVVILTTTEEKYYIQIDMVTTDTKSPQSEGIVAIAICKYDEIYAEDVQSEFYRYNKGDQSFFCFFLSVDGYGYLSGTPDGNESVSSESAIELSKGYLIAHCDETIEHLNSMVIEVGYNISYIHDGREPTWHVEFWGRGEDSDTDSSLVDDQLSLCYILEVNTTTGSIQVEVCRKTSFDKTLSGPHNK